MIRNIIGINPTRHAPGRGRLARGGKKSNKLIKNDHIPTKDVFIYAAVDVLELKDDFKRLMADK